MKQIYESQVQDELTVCPYCMNPPTRGQRSCCGENHFEEAIDTGDEIYLLSEVEIVPDLPPGNDPVVPLSEVKKALKVANNSQELYSASVLNFLVQKYTVFVLMLAIGFSSCAPLSQQADYKSGSGPNDYVFPYCDVVDNGETDILVCKKTLEEGGQ